MDLATLQDLVDRQAITQTLQRYAIAIDAFDFDAVGGVFTEDAIAHYGGYPELVGGSVISKFLGDHCRNTSWHQHMLTVVEIVIDGDRASSLTYLIAHAVRREPAGEVSTHVGDYRDDLIRTPAGWRISRRVQHTGHKAVTSRS